MLRTSFRKQNLAWNPVTHASDIFSLGMVLYELAAGRHPFDSSSDMAVLSAIILHDTVPPSRINSRVPQVLDSLVMRMLSKIPEQRPTASEVDDILDSIVALQTASRHTTTAVASQCGVIGRETVALGRCSERLAGAEAYLPLLDAIDDLLHDDRSPDTISAFNNARTYVGTDAER